MEVIFCSQLLYRTVKCRCYELPQGMHKRSISVVVRYCVLSSPCSSPLLSLPQLQACLPQYPLQKPPHLLLLGVQLSLTSTRRVCSLLPCCICSPSPPAPSLGLLRLPLRLFSPLPTLLLRLQSFCSFVKYNVSQIWEALYFVYTTRKFGLSGSGFMTFDCTSYFMPWSWKVGSKG